MLKPRRALNKAFLKVKPNRSDMERFKAQLVSLLNSSNETESEEFHKNLVSDFLKRTYYEGKHFINTKGRNDLVIHNGAQANSSVGVIIETKKPTNKAEMPQAATGKLNSKALQELVLYYLRERITHKNLEVKHLIITNIYEWYVFDAQLFDRLFAQNKTLVKQFTDFEGGRLSETKTDFFYRQIAEPFIAGLQSELVYTYFHLADYDKALRNANKQDDTQLIALFKLLSPEHLLKLPFANDSNSLDKRFYSELLHIIGLTETKEGGKKLIQRNKAGERHSGSLLEDAIIQLDSLDKLSRLERYGQGYGATTQDRLFNVALELVITWINRILFLKLLEAQLLSYHKGDASYAFLSLAKIKNYDDLNSLFFQVLARRQNERNEDVQQLFAQVPYLNSSLFEPTELEQLTLFISNLRDDKELPLHSQSVLKDEHGRKRSGSMGALAYLFAFLEAYDFSSEGAEDIQEDNKTLINASVLGLIFEKINGYKDGSFFTPGFITMYMCRETIRKAVLQKFNETKGWSCQDLDALYDKIEDRNEANAIVNSVKICDPAVGSGHFLVSALNEMIAVKNDLNILQDRQGRRLKEYQVEVVNDELIVTDEEGELFEYNPRNAESQRIQETLFLEKQAIIENCLFGVDINPNSVKICRLRLWIELLKNAYYKNAGELETLPNIDINIKVGNSLVSRFAMDADLKQALRKSKWTMDGYRTAVATYRNAENKEQKREMEQLIASIKSDFRSEIAGNDPKIRRLQKLEYDFGLLVAPNMFEESAEVYGSRDNKKKAKEREAKMLAEINKIRADIEEIKSNKIYENAFEWRFEFPEVLNNEGDFVGFDVVIGNPPYIRQEEFTDLKPYLQTSYPETAQGTADLFVYFVELSMRVLKQAGEFSFIIPNKWMRAGYGKKLRAFVAKKRIEILIDFGDLPVFEEATTYPNIVHLNNSTAGQVFKACNVQTLNFPQGLNSYLNENLLEIDKSDLSPEGWTLTNSEVQRLLSKLKNTGQPLSDYVGGKIYRGVLTGLNEAFVIDEQTKEQLIERDSKSAEIIKPFLAGRDIKRYQTPRADKYLIFTRRGIAIEEYTAILDYLSQFRSRLEPKPKNHKGEWTGRKEGTYKWYEIQDAVDYFTEFEKAKIIVPAIVKAASYAFDTNGIFSNDKTCIIPTNNLGLIGLLNSQLIDFYLKSIASTKQNGYYEYKPVYVAQLPIVDARVLEQIVQEILAVKKHNLSADITALEVQIDQLVYKLYDLTEEEIKIIEGVG
ncbi:MAG: TaqI-like C-terminal specificity domain-containing protein [Sphingobacteriaceae bacterium]|nr:TaqI-like C-terminal specificity domain-containing protein [Sphingobacteriaceae bacterium]